VARSFPLALQLLDKACLVVGSTPEAAERARNLFEAGARVEVVASRPCDELLAVIEELSLIHHERDFEATDLDGKWLAVSVERDRELSARVSAEASARRVFFCATDQPSFSSFSHMALARAGLVTVAIATEGRAPALAKRLRSEFERLFRSASLDAFAERLARLRDQTTSERRKQVLEEAVSGLRIDGKLLLPESSAD
jgi:siroheme synthase-like protein